MTAGQVTPGPQTAQYRQRDHLREEPPTSPSVYHTPRLAHHPVTEDTISGPGSQSTEYQHQNSPRPTPGNSGNWPGPSGEDEDNSYGPKN